MAAVVRVKRHLEDEPLEALILSCKKRKLNNESANDADDSELSTTLLKFAGTIKEDENVAAHLKKERIPEITELRECFKNHNVNIAAKLREQMMETSKNNRYKVVNCFRSHSMLDDVAVENSASASTMPGFRILDVEPDCYCHHMKFESKKEEGSLPKYVYDLYYTNSDDFGDAEIEDYISVYPLSGPLMFDSHRDNGHNIVDSEDDSEDSNAENYWLNDYPDESDLESIKEEDMIEAMQKVDIDEDLLSSDEGEEAFVYSVDNEGENLDQSDVDRYGDRYAQFKAAHRDDVTNSHLDNNVNYGDTDEDEYYY